MSSVPATLGDLPVVSADADHRVAICHDAEATGGYFVFGCDRDWMTETDSWHETLEDAIRQVKFEHPDATLENV